MAHQMIKQIGTVPVRSNLTIDQYAQVGDEVKIYVIAGGKRLVATGTVTKVSATGDTVTAEINGEIVKIKRDLRTSTYVAGKAKVAEFSR